MRHGWALSLTAAAGCASLAGLDGDYVVGAGAGGDGTTSSTGVGAGTATGTGAGGSAATGTPTAGVGGSGGSGGAGTGFGGAGGDPGPECGNGDLEPPGEECDDGDTEPLDGCSAACTVEDPDSCTAAPVIALGLTDQVTVDGDTTGAVDDVTNSTSVGECGAGTWYGPDHVWAVVPEAAGSLSATLDASFDYHYLHLRSACPGSTDLGCDYSNYASTVDDFTVPVQQGTTYYLIVDGWESTSGTYTLTVSLD